MGKPGTSRSTNYLSYVGWAGIIVAVAMALILNIPEPPLDWEKFVLPMTNKYVGLSDQSISPTPLKGINVVVSGATSGIGRGMTESLTKLGANVIAMGRSPEKLEALKKEVVGGEAITTVVADYNDLAEVARAANEINEQFDHIDILLNNAGIHEGAFLLDNPVSKQGYDRIYSVNYLAHVLLTEKLAPSLGRSERPVVAQMSSSFHWVGDWSDLTPGPNGEAPPASQAGGTGGLFRTQRGYGNGKLAMIFHSRALKRRKAELAKARIVSICPAWVGTNIMPSGTMGNLVIKHLGFKNTGWGIASTLYAIFNDYDDPEADYFSNSRALNMVAVSNEMAHAPWTFAFGLRDFGSFIMAFGVLGFQKLMAVAEPSISSPVTYNEELQDTIYDWSKTAIADWL